MSERYFSNPIFSCAMCIQITFPQRENQQQLTRDTMNKLNFRLFVCLRAKIIINDLINSICILLATAISAHRTGDRDIRVGGKSSKDYDIIGPNPMTMLGIHKLLNSIIVIAYCSACALVARIHVQYELCSPLSLTSISFCCAFIISIFVLFIDSFVCYLKSLGLIELRVQRLFAFLLHWTNGKDRWKDNKNGRMQQISYQPFGQIAWFDSTKNRKDELFLLCSELLPIVWILHADCVYTAL